jgi:D-3-phosphoglycerate dehydrogenase / 2-oxoglutarate reductase
LIEGAILGPRGVRIVGGDGASAQAVVHQAGAADVVLAGSAPRFDAEVLARLSCRGIVRYGVGLETVDLEAAARSGMWVAYVPDYGTDAVATHPHALLLAALRRIPQADALVRSGGWGISGFRPLHAPTALTAAIVGFGRIGQRVAQLLDTLGIAVIAHDAYVDVEAVHRGVRAVSLRDAMTADVITLHASGRADGRPLLGPAELARVKLGAVLVNTARGTLVDEGALIEGLQRGAPAIAALDVLADEPPGDRFAEVSERVILTPHMAWYTEESERDLRVKAAREALRIIDGQPPLNVAARPLDAA